MACEVYGGEEKPCISEKESKRDWLPLGRPCPRVDLLPENVLSARASFDLLSDITRAAAPFSILFDAYSMEEARTSLARAIRAVRSKQVQKALDRVQEREAKRRQSARDAEEKAARERQRLLRGMKRGHR